MTDPISMYGRLARLDPGSRNGRTDGTADATDASVTSRAGLEPAPRTAGRDEFVLSEIGREAMATEPFDKAKVDAIKDALRNGNYPLDSRRIAESFAAIERLIDG
jgi:negative regulator of flagellin synthesis FlgM